MAVPKRKTSKARRDKRRSPNMKMKAPGLSICPQCHEPKLPHRVCPNCNYYDGKDVMAGKQFGIINDVKDARSFRASFVCSRKICIWIDVVYYIYEKKGNT